MKHLLITSSLALSLSFGAAFAQQTSDPQTAPQAAPQTAPPTEGHHHHHPHNPQKQAAYLSQKLNLNAEQTARLEPILATQDQQMQALWQNQQLTPDARHQQMQTIHQQTEQQLSSVLTPDQMTQLKAMRHHGHWHHGQNDNDAPAAS